MATTTRDCHGGRRRPVCPWSVTSFGFAFTIFTIGALLVPAAGFAVKHDKQQQQPIAGGAGRRPLGDPNFRVTEPPRDGRRRYVAIGDLHGDITSALAILRSAGVIDETRFWAAGSDVVIQVGDVLDRGPHGHVILEYFEFLRADAALKGGEFIQLLGNHEWMNLKGDFRFVAPQVFDVFGGKDAWMYEMSPLGAYGSKLTNLPAMVVRHQTLFVHAGLLPEFASLGVATINKRVSEALAVGNFSDEPLLSDRGVVWTRQLIHQAQKGNCAAVVQSLQLLSAAEGGKPIKGMVVGHTIQQDGYIRSYCDGAFIAIDTCISRYMANCGHLRFIESFEDDHTYYFKALPALPVDRKTGKFSEPQKTLIHPMRLTRFHNAMTWLLARTVFAPFPSPLAIFVMALTTFWSTFAVHTLLVALTGTWTLILHILLHSVYFHSVFAYLTSVAARNVTSHLLFSITSALHFNPTLPGGSLLTPAQAAEQMYLSSSLLQDAAGSLMMAGGNGKSSVSKLAAAEAVVGDALYVVGAAIIVWCSFAMLMELDTYMSLRRSFFGSSIHSLATRRVPRLTVQAWQARGQQFKRRLRLAALSFGLKAAASKRDTPV